MKNEKAIRVFNSLITINNNRIEGYETASNETEESGLKNLFAEFITTSQKCKQELVEEVLKLDGEIAKETNTSGKTFRMWMDVSSALTGNDHRAILNSCEYGEAKALDTYDKVLENDLKYLSTEQQNMIIDQKAVLITDYDRIRTLRYALVEA